VTVPIDADSSRPRRLAFVGPYVRDGVQWGVIESVCRRLGFDGIAVAPSVAETGYEEHRQSAQIQALPQESCFVALQTLPRGRHLRRALRMLRQFRSINPDLVILTAEPHERVILDALAALSVLRRPCVIAIAMENRVSLPPGLRGRAIRVLWHRIDGIVAAASATVDSFRSAGMRADVPALPLVVAVTDPEPDAMTPASRGRFRVGYIGRLVEEKGVRDLVEAVADCPDVELTLAGPGPLEGELRALAGTPSLQGRLTVLGLVDRAGVWRILREVDVLALLSRTEDGWSEQFGYVLGEAMAVGTPLLGSDSGAIPEVIGPAGLIVPERSPSAAAAAIRRLQSDHELIATLGAAARNRYLEEFSVESCASKLAGFIEARMSERGN
jgi:glycosyltransferase involved in cell wall biosynthesis